MITRQGLRVYRDALDARRDPPRPSYYWMAAISRPASSKKAQITRDQGRVCFHHATATGLTGA